jgi:hypothetical protein
MDGVVSLLLRNLLDGLEANACFDADVGFEPRALALAFVFTHGLPLDGSPARSSGSMSALFSMTTIALTAKRLAIRSADIFGTSRSIVGEDRGCRGKTGCESGSFRTSESPERHS